MKYNIDKVIDFLAELTGCEIRMFTHEKKMIVNFLWQLLAAILFMILSLWRQ